MYIWEVGDNMGFVLDVNTNAFENDNGKYKVKVSPDANNGVCIVNGKLVATKGAPGINGSGAATNIVGNSIVGIPNNIIKIIRCTSAVSRRTLGASIEEGVYMPDIISHLVSNPPA